MKINEFLAEINMLPEAVHLLNKLQESGRIGEEYQERKWSGNIKTGVFPVTFAAAEPESAFSPG